MIGWEPGETFDIEGHKRSIAELLQQKSTAIVDMWDAVDDDHTMDAAALASLRRENSVSLAQGLTLLQQQVSVAAGLGPGFRPEIFEKIRDLPGVDILAATALAAFEGDLDLGTLSIAAKNTLLDIIDYVSSEFDIANSVADSLGAVYIIVQIVWGVIETIVEQTAIDRAIEENSRDAQLACLAPGYSAAIDRSQVADALKILSGPNWERLFFPTVRPFDPELAAQAAAENWGPDAHFDNPGPPRPPGFACCLTPQGWRVVSPIGLGTGNRISREWPPTFYGHSTDFGFGLLPMCPELPCHRSLIFDGSRAFDPAQSMPLLAGLGVQAWHLLWNRGPTAYAVDGQEISSAWSEYFGILREQVGRGAPGLGAFAEFNYAVCDGWKGGPDLIGWFFHRMGIPAAANPDGIVSFSDSLPVRAWDAFTEYQTALLDRLVVAYVDARTCAVAWRGRVAAAQAKLLTTPAVCDLDTDSIPDPAYRAAVTEAKRKRGGQCFIFGDSISSDWKDGPSVAPFVPNPKPIPAFPKARLVARLTGASAPPRASSTSAGGGAAIAAIATVGAGLALWKVLT